ncbi:MAG: efflux RND transporter periplasmic adaptor subunit [Candidatus Delongbacteria bacterium]|nr:efflux RND transporter periplasmic adaptor subunit [Candidatus Delongbacteria bacterium]
MKKYLTIILSLLLVLLTSCAKEEAVAKEDTSVEALQKVQGIPVKITKIAKQSITQWDEYSGTLSGFEEVTAFGMLGDNYSKVNIEVGDLVKKGDILAEFSTDFPGANYNQAKIGYETAEKTYNRMKKVFESGGISQQQLDEVEAQYKISKENFNSTKQLVKVISPTSGVVVNVNFDKGSKNDPKLPLCTIIKTGKLKTDIFIEEEKIAAYKKGQEVKLKWEGLKDQEFIGIINKISMSSNPQMRGFSIEILVDNKDEKLMPGIFVYVFTPHFTKEDIIVIPRESVFQENGQYYVYVADSETAKKKEITLGKNIGNQIEIVEGLAAGDRLISEGRALLKEGSKIKVVG